MHVQLWKYREKINLYKILNALYSCYLYDSKKIIKIICKNKQKSKIATLLQLIKKKVKQQKSELYIIIHTHKAILA